MSQGLSSGDSFENICIFHILDGLREGLSHFSQTSRVALVYAVGPDDPLHVYDPQHLLFGHEPKLAKFYLESDAWRDGRPDTSTMGAFEQAKAPHPQLTGMISNGGWSGSMHYQMWFTEHHFDMCSTGPTERWIEYAVGLLAQNMAARNVFSANASGYVLQGYATHAVRDYIVDRRNEMMGWDTLLRIYPVLDAVLGISKTLEEGAWPRGRLVFTEPGVLGGLRYMSRFPEYERPYLERHKHVRKLLQAVEGTPRLMASDGRHLLGVVTGKIPPTAVMADFRGGYGFLHLGDELLCSFSDGAFHSTNRKAVLVQVEEVLLESGIDPLAGHDLYTSLSALVHNAAENKHGCTLVLDLKDEPVGIAGQHMVEPLNLAAPGRLELAMSLSKVDGALHIRADNRLHRFACLLDGPATPGEDRARGARYNSALRFTAQHEDVIVVVVSSDRPVSIIQNGMELTAVCPWKPPTACVEQPPLLADWLG